FNRLVDAKIDAKNPRTQNRHLPKGLLTKRFVKLFTFICVTFFLIDCYFINSLSFLISPFVIVFLLAYSYTKRFTWLTHIWLGLCLSYAPLGAWVAITNQWPWPALSLGLAVIFWVAGFDIIYATQDEVFDRKEGIYSIVARLGLVKALWISRGFHLLSLLWLILFGIQNQLGSIYYGTVVLIAVGLFYEQSLVKPSDLSKVNAAFLNMNGMIGLFFFLGILLERITHFQ
ncbi:MAG: UbiA family prenyltransferase, partial [Deltaproteobacteria bacterium]|nr:UbiA family prenyltransferase [Deltaproteobacteria bacterium]